MNPSNNTQVWSKQDIITMYDMHLAGANNKLIAERLGRTEGSVNMSIIRFEKVLSGARFTKSLKPGPGYYEAAKNYNKEGADITTQSADELVKEFADYIDKIKSELVSYSTRMAQVVLDERGRQLLEENERLNRRVNEMEKEINLLRPVVDVVKKENTRSVLQRALNSLK